LPTVNEAYHVLSQYLLLLIICSIY